MWNFAVTSFVADDGCKYEVKETRDMRVLKVGMMYWRGVGDISSEGRCKGTRDGDEFGIRIGLKTCFDAEI